MLRSLLCVSKRTDDERVKGIYTGCSSALEHLLPRSCSVVVVSCPKEKVNRRHSAHVRDCSWYQVARPCANHRTEASKVPSRHQRAFSANFFFEGRSAVLHRSSHRQKKLNLAAHSTGSFVLLEEDRIIGNRICDSVIIPAVNMPRSLEDYMFSSFAIWRDESAWYV